MSAARPARAATSTCSWSACAPSPIAPRPSNVGTPRAAVKFPSEPPPVAPREAGRARLVRPAPLASVLEGSTGERRLEHEDRRAPPRLFLERLTRRPAADLFVRRPQHDDAAGERRADVKQGSGGEHADG